MKLRFAFLGLLSLIAVSCSYEESFVPEDDYDNSAVEFYATIDEQPDADTKVYADDQLRVLWNADDRFSIFNKNTFNQEYQFLGDDGSNSGRIKRVANADGTGDPLEKIYAVYPYDESTVIDASGTISFTLPDEQSYLTGSFGIGANPMVSVTDDNKLRFKNAGGYLSLKFFGEGVSISSIVLKSNNGELLSGPCTIATSSGVPTLTMAEGASDQVTLTCEIPVVLGATAAEAVPFIFVLPPTTLEKGFTVTVTTPEGTVFEKSSGSKRVIARSSITRLGAMEVVPEYPKPNNVIYYTSTDGEIVTPYASDVFGANIISNEYVDGQGIITFDGDVTSIGYYAFRSCFNLTSISIPKTVISIGDYAFIESGITSVVIPKSVTSIARGAFTRCSSLSSVVIPDSITSIGDSVFKGCSGLTSIALPNSISSIGGSAFSGCSGLMSITIPNSVTNIEGSVFSGCSGLKNITIPNSVTSIGNYAFNGCSGLKNITIPNSVTSIGNSAFSGCSGLTSVSIPNSVTSIGDGVFAGCHALMSFSGKYASLDGAYLLNQGSIIAIAEGAFNEGVVIPDYVTGIGNSAFSNCTSLKGIMIPENVTSIGNSAFYGCSGLKQIIMLSKTPPTGGTNMFQGTDCIIWVLDEAESAFLSAKNWKSYADRISSNNQFMIFYTSSDEKVVSPYCLDSSNSISYNKYDGFGEIYFQIGMTKIWDNAFRNCSNLKRIVFPTRLNRIGDSAFSGCSGLTSITFPKNLEYIGWSAFWNCSGLTSVKIPDNVTAIGPYAFAGCHALMSFSGKYASSNGLYLIKDGLLIAVAAGAVSGSIRLPNDVTEIGGYVFMDCSSISSITIPNSVTSIGYGAFSGCSRLTSVTIPNSVTSIDTYAFYMCSGLTSVTIPNSVTSIGTLAFAGCSGLTNITIPNSVRRIGHLAFGGCSSLTSITINSINPPICNLSPFPSEIDCPIYVPAESVEAYKAAEYWSDYADRIQAIPE